MAYKYLKVGRRLFTHNLLSQESYDRTFLCVARTACIREAHKYAQADVKPSKFTVVYRDLHGSIDEGATAKDFVYALKQKERQLLLNELEKFESLKSAKGEWETGSTIFGIFFFFKEKIRLKD